MEIKCKRGKVLFKNDSPSIKETIEDAIRKGTKLIDARLIGAHLSKANLIGANLKGANLSKANLTYAYIKNADLSWADLRGADLRGADLSGANLKGANLNVADLNEANLKWANLSKANLTHAYIRNADLSWADLRGADLRGADLNEANLKGANISVANLRGTKNVPYIPLVCPSEGSFVGWKKIYSKSIEYLVKLRIPEDARRCSATTSKCRCDKAEVLAIECLSTGDKDVKEIINHAYNNECAYTVGEMVYPDSFDENRWNECSHGIHFFINKQDAIDY